MSVTLVVLAAALIAAVVIWALSRSSVAPDPIDPEVEERWLVRWLGSHPRFGRAARHVDRRVAGGLMLVVSLAVVLGTAVAVGVLFDMVHNDSGFARWDRSVADWGSRHATERSTDLLLWLTDLGGTGYLAVIAVVIGIVDYVRLRNINAPLFLLATVGGVALVNNVLKLIVDRERPDVEHLSSAAGSSFPSGHSAAGAAAWCAFALVLSRRWPSRRRALAAAAAAVIAVAVATSRALLGVHWLTDVLAGLALGWGWFLLCALAFGGRLQLLGEPAVRAAREASPTPRAEATVGRGR
jgi:membrane-associated phospholipid phosphatase